MNLILQVNSLLKKNEKIYFLFLLLGLFFVVFVDIFSFSLIIPAFQIIFLNKSPQFLFIDFSQYEQINFLQVNFKQIFLITFVLFFVIKNILIIYFELIFLNYFKKINIRISSELFQNYINQDYIYFLKNSSENTLQKVTSDVEKFTLFFVSLMHFLIDALFLIGISFLLIKINFYFFFICLTNFVIFIFIYLNFFNKRIKLWSNTYREAFGKNQSLVIEGLKAFKDLIIYNQKETYISKFEQNRSTETHSSMRITFLSHVQKYWLEIVGIIILLLITFYLIFIKYDLLDVLPILTLFTAVLFRLLTSLSRILANFALLKFHFPSAQILISDFKQFNNYKKKEFSADSEFIFNNNNIEVKNISFSYNNDNKNIILKNISFKVNKGDLVGVLGPNGSGKTTLINLISGFLEPTTGKIIIDNKYELYKNREQWFKSIACVHQNIFLWDTSIKNNIVLSNASYDDIKFDYLKDLLKLDKYFNDLPNKLDTIIGLDGIKISGGQKQLISIARALYKEVDILIFDEPTSSLDDEKIILIKDIILNLKRKKTIFIVTHHKDLFYKHFDKVIEVNK